MNEFKIVKNIKEFIYSLDNIIIPNRDRNLKDRMYNTSYDLLYYVHLNNFDKNSNYFGKILANISVLDFCIERCYKKKYINGKLCEKESDMLLKITKMVYGWIKYKSESK